MLLQEMPHPEQHQPTDHDQRKDELLGERDGVRWVNDSISTTPHASLAALDCFAGQRIALLVGGPDGLDDIRTIVAQAGDHLLPGGWLLLEHGHDQGAAVRALLTAAGVRSEQVLINAGELSMPTAASKASKITTWSLQSP